MKIIIAILFISLSLASHAQDGLKYDGKKTERYVEGKDKKIGSIVIDNVAKISWMRCAVDQVLESSGHCGGKAANLTYLDASAFAERVGDGWRLPTIWELEAYASSLFPILSGGQTNISFGRTYWSCHNDGFWSQTSVTGESNNVNAMLCAETSAGNETKRKVRPKHDLEYKFPVILVRNIK